MPYNSLWLFQKGFAQTQISMLLMRRDNFKSHLVLGNYAKHVRTRDLCRNRVHTKNIQEKGYCELLVLLSMLFVHLFVHIRKYNPVNQVGVKPVYPGLPWQLTRGWIPPWWGQVSHPAVLWSLPLRDFLPGNEQRLGVTSMLGSPLSPPDLTWEVGDVKEKISRDVYVQMSRDMANTIRLYYRSWSWRKRPEWGNPGKKIGIPEGEVGSEVSHGV